MKGYYKKQATRFFKDGYIRKGAIEETYDMAHDFSWEELCLIPREWKVACAIHNLAYKYGWDGNHWDNPLHRVVYAEN